MDGLHLDADRGRGRDGAEVRARKAGVGKRASPRMICQA